MPGQTKVRYGDFHLCDQRTTSMGKRNMPYTDGLLDKLEEGKSHKKRYYPQTFCNKVSHESGEHH